MTLRRRTLLAGALGAAAPLARAAEPLTLLHTGDLGVQPVIEATLDGHPARWLLDSGSTIAVISPALAARANARRIDRRRVATAGGVQWIERVELPPLVAAGQRLAVPQALVLDLADTLGEVGAAVDGLIGAPALRERVTRLDFAARRWGFDSGPGSSAAAWPLRWDEGLPVVDLALGERTPAPFVLDTGNAGALVVFERHARTLGGQDGLPRVTLQELGGRVELRQALLERLRAPGLDARDLPIAFEAGERARRGAHFDRLAGSVGNALFAAGALTIDGPGQRVLVDLPGLPSPAPLPGGFGFALRSRTGEVPRVSAVFDGGPAARAGVKPGAALLTLDDRPTTTASAVWQALYGATAARFGFEGSTALVALSRERFFARWA